MMDTAERVTDQIQKAAVSTRASASKIGGPTLIVIGLLQVLVAWKPHSTIGHIAQGVGFMVGGLAVWELKLNVQGPS